MTQWNDEQIIAYLDGKLDMEQGQELHREREQNPALDAYVQSMEIDIGELSQAVNDVVPGAPAFNFDNPPRRSNMISKSKRAALPRWSNPAWKQVAMAASVLAVFGLGFITSKLLPSENPPPAGWVQAVAEYQMLYSGQTLVLLEKTDDQRSREVAEIGRKMDIILARNDLEIEGLTYKRGQLLTFKNKPLVQFAYLDGSNIPIAFCIIKRGAKPDQPLKSKKMIAGQNAVVWATGNYGYVVIGKSEPKVIEKYARQLKARLESI